MALLALYKNHGCLKWISGLNASPPNKNLLIITFSYYILKTKYHPIMVSCSKEFWLKLALKTTAFLPFDRFLFLTVQFDGSIVLLLLAFETFRLLLSVFVLHFKQYNNSFLQYIYAWDFRLLFILLFCLIIYSIPTPLPWSINLFFSTPCLRQLLILILFFKQTITFGLIASQYKLFVTDISIY